jgi:hypothetical protein
VDEAMAQPWIVEECRRQAVIYVAAASAAARYKQRAACPAPLFGRNGPLAELIEQQWKAAMGCPVSPAAVATTVAGLLREARSDGFPCEAWTYGELIWWWLRAGEAIATLPASWRAELAQAITMADGGQPAALWCADRGTHYALVLQDFELRRAEHQWQGRADSLTPYVRKLFEWVTHKDRPRLDRPELSSKPWAWVDAMRLEGEAVAEDARRLFGPRRDWHAGEPLTVATVKQWRAVVWHDKMRHGSLLEQIRPPVVDGGRGSQPLVRGWVACQPPGAVVYGLVGQLGASAAAGDSFTTAIRFAARCWDARFLPSRSWVRVSGVTETPPPVESEAGFLAVVRALSAAELQRQPAPDDGQSPSPVEAVLISLGLDGFHVRVDDGGAAEKGRMIPWIATRVLRAPLRFVVERQSWDFRVDVGWTPAEPCPATRLAHAVEEFDWRVWQMTVLAQSRPRGAIQSMAEITGAAGKFPHWEAIKRQLVAARMDAAPETLLAQAFDYAQRRRLTLELLRRKTAAKQGTEAFDPLLAGLIDTCREVASAVLERMHAVDSASLTRLMPPRLVDGPVNGLAWLSLDVAQREDEVRYTPLWRRDGRPCGQSVEEFRDPQEGNRVVLSAGDASESDVRLLNAALGKASLICSPDSDADDGAWLDLVRRFGARVLERVAAGTGQLDLGADIAWLRERCTGSDAHAFHVLVRDRLARRQAACDWCMLLAEDERFGFDVYPPVDFAADALAVAQPGEGHLRWDFHDTIPAGTDIDVRYALAADQARRTISRGPRVAGSAADLAEKLNTVASDIGPPWGALAAAVRDATDRWLAFPGRSPHPVTVVAPLLRALVRAEDTPASARAGVFAALRGWAASVGHNVVPACWVPDRPLEAAALPTLATPPVFHDTVPAGCLVLESLGLDGEHALPVEAMLSAGPPPSGYPELREALESLERTTPSGHTPSWEEAVRRVRDVPRHALANTLTLAGPNLYDCIWETAALGTGESDVGVERAKEQIVSVLKAACAMVPFQPATPRELPTGWIQEVGGTPPRGRRIRSLVRPGLRTVGNQLVRPAIVISE